MEKDPSTTVRIISETTVRPSSHEGNRGGKDEQHQIHLTPWDLRLLSIKYIQMGILLPKPPTTSAAFVCHLVSSLSAALDHFSPLAGRLATTKHDTTPPSLSVFIDCGNQGAQLIHAVATDVTASHVLRTPCVPSVVESFFPLNDALGLDGHSLPLFAAQVTELADGVFLGCSLSHAVAGGATFWHLVNSWAEISRTGRREISRPPELGRWFPETCPPPLRLPFDDLRGLTRRLPAYDDVPPNVSEAFFPFPRESVKRLKAAANSEMETNRISSLQALLAHAWIAVVRARKLEGHEETGVKLAIGHGARVDPPLPAGYLGNSMLVGTAKASAGEVLGRGLGWVAWQLNRVVASHTGGLVRDRFESWARDPTFVHLAGGRSNDLSVGASPRFDVYGNDFGWGRPAAVRSGGANKTDGDVMAYPGPEEGSMALDIYLSPQALSSLLEDEEFMEATAGERKPAQCNSRNR